LLAAHSERGYIGIAGAPQSPAKKLWASLSISSMTTAKAPSSEASAEDERSVADFDATVVGLAECLVVVDVVQLLSFCPATSWAALRAVSKHVMGHRLIDDTVDGAVQAEGLFGDAALRRLAAALLQGPQRIRGSGMSLHEAVDFCDIEAVWAHLYLGARPNEFDRYGCVPMHYAVERKHVGIFRILQRAGADLQVGHKGLNMRAGWTPLHFAAYAGARDVVLLLLLAGVDVNRMDGCRRTALFYARNRNREACARLLEKFGGRADSHLVEAANLREAQRMDEDAALNPARDASTLTDRNNERAPLRSYVGPAGDTGPSLTMAAALMPGFEW